MFYKSELINKLDKIEKSLISIKQERCNCNLYKELLEDNNTIIENKLLENKKDIIHTISENIKNNTQYINEAVLISKIQSISQKINTFTDTVDIRQGTFTDAADIRQGTLYFDNETIKHQLFLENELKKSIQDIENLSVTIHNIIKLINYTIYKIDKIDKIVDI